MSAVALCGLDNVAKGKFVHNETTEWVLTSDRPIDFVWTCDENSLCNQILPGRLGMFVYPSDIRFHMTGKNHTSKADLDSVARAERAISNRECAHNIHHLSVTHEINDDFIPNQDTGDESEEEEEEEEQENVILDECLESDEEGDGEA